MILNKKENLANVAKIVNTRYFFINYMLFTAITLYIKFIVRIYAYLYGKSQS